MSEKDLENSDANDDNKDQDLNKSDENNTEMTAAEKIARPGGWKPEEEWDPDDPQKPGEFISAEMFNERGKWIKQHKAQEKRINDLETTFNTRMSNANKIHQQQMEVQKADLVRKRDEAIDSADRELANGFQDDIDKLNIQPVDTAPASNEQTTLDEWNTNNPWILGNDPKAAYAKQQFTAYQIASMSTTAAIAQMEKDVNKAFPILNPDRDNQAVSEGGSKPGGKRAGKKLSMSDLTSDELKWYRAMPGAWESEKAYLQAVQDTRGDS